MAIAGILGSLALAALVPALARTPIERATVALLALAFHPIARTTFGGQNTVLRGRSSRDRSGRSCAVAPRSPACFVGLLSYKPQYVPFLVLALVLTRAWTTLAWRRG
jgi:hypothetical protein